MDTKFEEEIERIKINLEELIDTTKELYLAYNAKDEESPVKWLNGKFNNLYFCLKDLGVDI